jgi:hypothetical protein
MNCDPSDVYEFIHLMSSAERRYFSTRHRKGGKSANPQFFKFYEFIVAERIQNDEQLRSHVDAGPFLTGKHLSMEKKRLLAQLLATMVDYDTAGAPSIQRKRLFSEAESLESRGYLTLAKERLLILKDKAEKIGNWPLLLDLSVIDGRIKTSEPNASSLEGIQRRFQERRHYLAQLDCEVQLRFAWEKLLFLKRYPKTEGKPQILLDIAANLGALFDLVSSHPALYHWHQIGLSLLALLQGDTEAAQLHYRKVVETLLAQPLLVQENPLSAMFHFYNYLNLAHSNQDYSEFETLVPQVEKLQKELDRNGQNQNNYARALWIIYFANNRQLAKAAMLAMQQLADQPQALPGTPISSHIVSVYNAIVLLFFSAKYKEAMTLIDKVLASQKQKMRTDLRDALFVFEAVLLFELGEEARFLAKINSLRARTIDDEGTKTYFKLVVKILNDCYRSQSANSGNAIDWAGHVSRLQVVSTQFKLLKHLGVHEISLWVQSKALQIPVEEAMALDASFSFPRTISDDESTAEIEEEVVDTGD